MGFNSGFKGLNFNTNVKRRKGVSRNCWRSNRSDIYLPAVKFSTSIDSNQLSLSYENLLSSNRL